ncbi:MAG: synthase subunit [Bacteroidetes bacterium]|jgi:F-type H+-transporting ATPase subunit b|nr:synthase subunit [Bacteroidota bacterium]
MLEINPGLIIWTIVTFVIVLAILRATAWKPLLGALTAREEKIRLSLAEAQNAQQQAQALLEENRKQLALAEEQSQRIIREGRDLGERLKAEILEKANASARSAVEQAREEIQREKESALTQLRSEVADLAIQAAGKILDANLDTAKQRALVDAVIRDINKG